MTDAAYRSYRTDDIEHPFTVFGPSGYDDRWTVLTNGACEGVEGDGNRANVARWVVKLLNHLHKSVEGRKVVALEAKRKDAQPCIRGFFSALGYTVAWSGAVGGFQVSRPGGKLSDVDTGIRVIGRVFALVWPFYRRMKKDPMILSKRQREYRRAKTRRREEGRRRDAAPGSRRRKTRRSTSYALLRVKQTGPRKWDGPKRLVPDIREKAAKAAVEDKWPEVLRVANVLESASGCRGGKEIEQRTMHDWLMLGSDNSMASTNKNSGDERVKALAFNDPRREILIGWVNGGRLARDPGRDMAHFEALAATAKAGGPDATEAEAELKGALIFLGPRAGRAYSYRTKARYFRNSMTARGIVATGHMQRHEHSSHAVAEIDAMPIDEGMKLALMREHGRQKHWADVEAMLEIYAEEKMAARRVRLEVEFQDRADRGQLAIQRRKPDEIDMPDADIVASMDLPERYARVFSSMPA